MNYVPNKILKNLQIYQAIEKQNHLILLHIAAQCLRVIFLIKRMNIHFYGWEKKGFIKQDNCVGDIDYEWQKIASANWLKKMKNSKITVVEPMFSNNKILNSEIKKNLKIYILIKKNY